MSGERRAIDLGGVSDEPEQGGAADEGVGAAIEDEDDGRGG